MHAGTHFDPRLVPLFLALGARFESVYLELIDRGTIHERIVPPLPFRPFFIVG